MLKKLTLALGIAVLAGSVNAHSQGHRTIEPDQAIAAAIDAAGYFSINKIDRDWSPLPQIWAGLPISAAKILARVDGDYIVSVTNTDEGRIFYMLVAGDGGIIDANFTGTFPYVWDLKTDGIQKKD